MTPENKQILVKNKVKANYWCICFVHLKWKCHKDGKRLHCWGPKWRTLGFQEPFCIHLGINTHHCFPCKTPDMDDKCHPPWQSPQTEAYTSHSACPGNSIKRINHLWLWEKTAFTVFACVCLKALTMVLLWHSRQTSGLFTPAQLLCLLQLHWDEQLSPTNPKWHWQTPGDTHVPFTQPCAHTGSQQPDPLYGRKTRWGGLSKSFRLLWEARVFFKLSLWAQCLRDTCWLLILPAEYVTLFAVAVVSLRQVMAVLGGVAMMMAVGTLVLLGTVQEGPAAVSQWANTFTHTWERRMGSQTINLK